MVIEQHFIYTLHFVHTIRAELFLNKYVHYEINTFIQTLNKKLFTI